MKILIVEDDQPLLRSLKTSLHSQYVIDTASTKSSSLKQLEENMYDLAIIDLTLPDGNGLDLCRYIRNQEWPLPILILTGQNATPTKVSALNYGADDYLTKPFSLEELKARLHALLRRPHSLEPNLIKIGDLSIDTLHHQVKRAGQSIPLRRKEFSLLHYLARHQGKVVTRTMLLDHVWESDINPASNTIDVHIKTLRRKIDQPFTYPLIKTIYGLGYTITPDTGGR